MKYERNYNKKWRKIKCKSKSNKKPKVDKAPWKYKRMALERINENTKYILQVQLRGGQIDVGTY